MATQRPQESQENRVRSKGAHQWVAAGEPDYQPYDLETNSKQYRNLAGSTEPSEIQRLLAANVRPGWKGALRLGVWR